MLKYRHNGYLYFTGTTKGKYTTINRMEITIICAFIFYFTGMTKITYISIDHTETSIIRTIKYLFTGTTKINNNSAINQKQNIDKH